MLYRGDDTQAFNGRPIIVKLENAEGLKIELARFKCGPVVKDYQNPVFPITVYLTSEETKQLKPYNECRLAVFDVDDEGNLRKHTCKGSLVLKTKKEVV